MISMLAVPHGTAGDGDDRVNDDGLAARLVRFHINRLQAKVKSDVSLH